MKHNEDKFFQVALRTYLHQMARWQREEIIRLQQEVEAMHAAAGDPLNAHQAWCRAQASKAVVDG